MVIRRKYGSLGYKIAKLKFFRNIKKNHIGWFIFGLAGATLGFWVFVQLNVLLGCAYALLAIFYTVSFFCEILYLDMISLREAILPTYGKNTVELVYYNGDETELLTQLACRHDVCCTDIACIECYAALEERNEDISYYIMRRVIIRSCNGSNYVYEDDITLEEFFDNFSLKDKRSEKIEKEKNKLQKKLNKYI